MKKLIIGAAVAAAIGVGGYFAMNKGKEVAGDFGEQQFKAFITANQNKPYPIKELQSHPMIQRADVTITEASDTLVKSVFTLQVAGEDTVEIPLNSEITRGEFKYAEESYGYGKIVTKPELSGLGDLPPFINKDTLTNTSYLGLNGDIASVTAIAPVQIAEEGVNFQGLTAVVDTSVLDSSEYDMKLDFAGLSVNDNGDMVDVSEFNMTFDLDKDGTYKGESTPFSFNVDSMHGGPSMKMDFSKGTFKGNHKTVEGLDSAISNGKTEFENLSLVIDGTPIKLNNLVIDGGIYDIGDKQVDIKIDMNTDIDGEALKAMLPVPVEPKSLKLKYGLSNIGYDAFNTYMNAFSTFDPQSSDMPFSDEEQRTLITSLQKTGFAFEFETKATTSEGDGEAKIDFAINDAGKAADVEAFLSAFRQDNPQLLMGLVDGKAKAKLNKGLADMTGASMFMLMSGAKEEGDDYVIEAELKDGVPTMNGQPMPMM